MRRGVHGLGRWVAFSSIGFGASLILFSFSKWLVLSAILLVPVGYGVMLQMSSPKTMIQAMIPDDMGASAGGFICWRHLPKLRLEARELLVAQGLAGEPEEVRTIAGLRTFDILR